MNNKITEIPIDKIAIDLRDDVLLRTYVLDKRDRQVWEDFLSGARKHGMKPREYEAFLDLHSDIKMNGLKEPIKLCKIGERYYIEDGAHRLSILLSLKKTTIAAEIFSFDQVGWPSIFLFKNRVTDGAIPKDVTDPRIEKIFTFISPSIQEKILSHQFETPTHRMCSECLGTGLIAKIPLHAMAVVWSPALRFFLEIVDDFQQFYTVEKLSILECTSQEVMHKLIYELYESDDVAKWKVKSKFNHCDRAGHGLAVIKFKINDAKYRIKKATGNDISMEVEDLKRFIRNKYKGKMKEYPKDGQPDLIIHACDNEYQSKAMKNTIEKFIKLKEINETEAEFKPIFNRGTVFKA